MPLLILASLLLHLALILGAIRLVPRAAARPADSPPLIVEQWYPDGPGKPVARAAAGPVARPAGRKEGSGAAVAPSKAPKRDEARLSPAGAVGGARQLEPAAVKPAYSGAQPASVAAGSSAPATVPLSGQGLATVPAAGEGRATVHLAGEGRSGSAAGFPGGVAKREGNLGPARASGPAAASPGIAEHRKGDYQARLNRLIEAHKEYPATCRRKGVEGSCQRRFVLTRDGSLKKLESLSHCGHPFLDEAATRAITSVGKFPRLPVEFDGAEATFVVSITFKLSD
jgi:periplasmic protein TonB